MEMLECIRLRGLGLFPCLKLSPWRLFLCSFKCFWYFSCLVSLFIKIVSGLTFGLCSLTLFVFVILCLLLIGIEAIESEWPNIWIGGFSTAAMSILSLPFFGELTLLLTTDSPLLNYVSRSLFLELSRPARAVTLAGR